MGAAFRLSLVRLPALPEALPHLRRAGWRTLAAVPDASAAKVTKTRFDVPTVMAVGNEGSGLLPETIRACSGCVTIPMSGRAESLNASASAAILMWEMTRECGDERG